RAALLGLLCACHTPLSELDGAFYSWDDREVHCAVEVEDRDGWPWQELLDGLDRARDNGEVVEMLVHRPGESMTWPRFEQLLAAARDRGLPFLTATDMVNGAGGAGIALMYDDWYLDTWLASLDLLAQYQARVTIYVAHYDGFDAAHKAQVRQLADA